MNYGHPETLSERHYGNFNLLTMSRELLGSDIVFFSIKNVLFFPFTNPEGKVIYSLNPFGKTFLDILYTNHISLIGYEEQCTEEDRTVFQQLFQKHGLFYLRQIVFPEDFHLFAADDSFYQQLHLTYGQQKKIGFLSRKTILYARLHGLESVKYTHPLSNPHRIPRKQGVEHSLFFSYGVFLSNTILFNGTLRFNRAYEDGFGRFSLFCYDFCCWLHEHAQKEAYTELLFLGDGFLVYHCFRTLFPDFPSTLLYLETDSIFQESEIHFPGKLSDEKPALVLWKPVSTNQIEQIQKSCGLPFFSLFSFPERKKREQAITIHSYLHRRERRKNRKIIEKTSLLLSRKDFSVTRLQMGQPVLKKNPEDDYQLEYLSSLHSGVLAFMKIFPQKLSFVGTETPHLDRDPSVLLLMENTFHPKKKSFKKSLRQRFRRIPLARKCYKALKSYILSSIKKKEHLTLKHEGARLS